jgi:integrase
MIHAQPHLSKRGQIYQWRRKFRSQSTEIFDLQISLRTQNRLKALIIARVLTAESDKVFDAIDRNYLTKSEARAWMTQVAQAEMAKPEKLHLIQKMDGGYDEQDRRLDWANRKAWRLLSDRGIEASLDQETLDHLKTEGASAADVDSLEYTLKLLSRHMLSEAVTNRQRREFLELTGRVSVSAYEMLQLRQLTSAAKAAAWERFEASPPRPAQDMAEEIARELGSMQFSADVTTPEGSNSCEIQGTAKSSGDVASKGQIARTELENYCDEDSNDYDPDIFAVIERMNAIKREEGIEERTLKQYFSFARLFVTITGKRDVTKLRQSDAAKFREMLYKLPKSWGKSSRDATATLEDMQARAAKLPPEKVGLSIGTLNRHLDHLQQVVAWADNEGIAIHEKLRPNKLRRREPERANEKRDQYTTEQLRRLFTHPVWTGSHSQYYQLAAGSEIYRNGMFWVPIICAYTGARRAEICGLPTTAIKVENGIAYFDIDVSEERRLKTKASKRRLPIHSRLIELGFMDHVKAQRQAGSKLLFPDLYDATLDAFGRDITRKMRQINDEVFGAKGAKLSLHSMKHYVQNVLSRDTTVPDVIVREIVAHEGKDIHETVYEKGSPIEDLKYAIERLPIVY